MKVTFVSLAELRANPPKPMPALWGPVDSPWIVSPSLVAIGAEQKVGKSLFAKDFLHALLDPGCHAWLGVPIGTVSRVLYLNEEVPQPGIHKRATLMWKAGAAWESEFILSPERGVRFDTDPTQFLEITRDSGARVICIDPLDRYHCWNTNDNQFMGQLMNRFHDAINKYGVTVVFVHHFAKEQNMDTRTGFTRMRGSGRLLGDADSIFTLERRKGGVIRLDAQLRHGEWPGALDLRRTPGLRYELAATAQPSDMEVVRQCAADGVSDADVVARATALGVVDAATLLRQLRAEASDE